MVASNEGIVERATPMASVSKILPGGRMRKADPSRTTCAASSKIDVANRLPQQRDCVTVLDHYLGKEDDMSSIDRRLPVWSP
jgi:hypothetical protein